MAELPTKDSVFGRRTVPQSTRGIYGYQAGQEAAADARRGQTMASIGADVEVKAKEMSDEQNKLDLLRAQTKALDDYSRLEREMEQDPDATWETYEPKFREADAATVGIFRDKKMAGEFGYRLQQMTIGAREKYAAIDDKRNIDIFRADVTRDIDILDRNIAEAAASGDLAKLSAAVEMRSRAPSIFRAANPRALTEQETAAYEIATGDAVYNGLKDADPAQTIDLIKGSVKMGPPKPMAGGFEAHIPLLLEIEGGYNKSDGKSGHAVIYGINKGAHPKEHDEALRITEAEGKEAGKAYAAGFYKREYWDANGLDKYTPEQQAVLIDGVVNHGFTFRSKLLAAADDGASPVELLAMRHKEYQRLARDPEHAKSYKSWMKRLNDVEKSIGVSTTKTGTAIDFLTPGQRAELLEYHEKKYEQMLPEMAVEEYKWKPFEPLSEKYAGNEGSQTAVASLRKSFEEDPVAYVQEFPRVMEARAAMEQDPTPQNVSNYNAAVWESQSEIGLPSYKKRITSPKQAADAVEAIKSAQSGGDILKAVDGIHSKYSGNVKARAIREISQADGAPAGLATLMRMNPNDATRPILASGLTMSTADLAAASGAKYDSVKKKAGAELSDYRLAKSTDPDDGARDTADLQASVEIVAMSLMQRGMEESEAIKEAKKYVLPATIKGSLIIPNSIPNPDNVETAADEFRVNIQDMNIVVPAEIRGDDIKTEVYKRSMSRDAKPVVDGGRVIFVGLDGNAIIDADLAEFDPETGDLTNEDEAIISFPLTDAAIYPEGVSKSAPDLVQKRAEIAYAAGDDIKKKYFTPSLFSRDMDRENFIQGKFVTVQPIKAITKQQWDNMLPQNKYYYKKNAEKNYEYFKKVLEDIPEQHRQKLIDLAKLSNEPLEKIVELQDETKKSGSQFYLGVRTKNSIIAEMKENRLKASAGIGYNYYNGLPDWMVD